MIFFFKQKTAYEMRISDCSSDVCSSDLEPPPPPPDQPVEPPPVVAPPPIVQTPAPPPAVTIVRTPPPVFTPTPVAAPPPPPPPPPKQAAKPASPRGNPGTWVTPDDYPSRALREEREGTTGFKLAIDANGKVVD